MPPTPQRRLRFHAGTLLAEGATVGELPPGFVDDDRVGCPRAPAWLYADTVRAAIAAGAPFLDEARTWEPLPLVPTEARSPRPYQQAAVEAWVAAGRRGAILLPTGAGKTFVAELAMASTRRPTLVLAPTLDLVAQWARRLETAFGQAVGVLGGGQHEVLPLTVSTYDSAFLHLHRYGDRFGLIVFDEVHHLAAPGYLRAAESALAPFRLGLTATWERQDGRHEDVEHVVGPVVYERGITELAGEFLADYETIRLLIELSPDETEAYQRHRKLFTDFLVAQNLNLRGPGGWQQFLRVSARSREGRAAFSAYQESRRIAHGTEQKLQTVARLLREEAGRRAIIFTHDNATAFTVSRRLLVPCITHHTDVKDRRAILDAFEAGTLPTLATSRVLNEGVDLPAAEVAIVMSGTGTVREHVQRLGRILRPKAGKQATLYELVAANTAEVGTSARRRKHDAYQ